MDYRPVPFVNTGAVCYVNSTWQAILSLKAVQDKLHDQILLYRMQGEAPADLADSNLLKVALLLQVRRLCVCGVAGVLTHAAVASASFGRPPSRRPCS
jgi:ubiquitin C-terminal hydrolase